MHLEANTLGLVEALAAKVGAAWQSDRSASETLTEMRR
jgi:hypothetical protein